MAGHCMRGRAQSASFWDARGALLNRDFGIISDLRFDNDLRVRVEEQRGQNNSGGE